MLHDFYVFISGFGLAFVLTIGWYHFGGAAWFAGVRARAWAWVLAKL